MAYSATRRCEQCGANNRIPARHLSDAGRCGACKAALPPRSEPIEVDRESFDQIIGEARCRCWWTSGRRGAGRAGWRRRRCTRWRGRWPGKRSC